MTRASLVSITQLKRDAAELVRDISNERGTLTVTQNGEPAVVVMGVDAWNEVQDTLAMLKLLALSESSVREQPTSGTTEVFAAAHARLQARTPG